MRTNLHEPETFITYQGVKDITRILINSKRFTREISVFHGRQAPEKGTLVGYGAIIETLSLQMPFPSTLALISE